MWGRMLYALVKGMCTHTLSKTIAGGRGVDKGTTLHKLNLYGIS